MNSDVKKKRSSVHLALDIVIGVLCVIVVVSGLFAIFSLKENYSYNYDADSFYYRLQDENFGLMVEMYYANEAAGVRADEELQQYYGVAKYFEAASYYKMYQETENAQQMNTYYEKMEAAEQEMGELSFLSETICEKLEFIKRLPAF